MMQEERKAGSRRSKQHAVDDDYDDDFDPDDLDSFAAAAHDRHDDDSELTEAQLLAREKNKFLRGRRR